MTNRNTIASRPAERIQRLAERFCGAQLPDVTGFGGLLRLRGLTLSLGL